MYFLKITNFKYFSYSKTVLSWSKQIFYQDWYVIIMGICPRCGSWVDEGEPYVPNAYMTEAKPMMIQYDFQHCQMLSMLTAPPTEDTSLRRPLRKWDMTWPIWGSAGWRGGAWGDFRWYLIYIDWLDFMNCGFQLDLNAIRWVKSMIWKRIWLQKLIWIKNEWIYWKFP